jgi:hypothetical protein
VETGGTYGAEPKFKDPANGDLNIAGRGPMDAGVRNDGPDK